MAGPHVDLRNQRDVQTLSQGRRKPRDERRNLLSAADSEPADDGGYKGPAF